MERGKMKYLAGIVFVILLFSLITGFEIGDKSHSIDKIYSPSDSIKGWVNISLEESTNSKFEDSFGNSIILLDLLKKGSYNYSCNIPNCDSDYSEGNVVSSFIMNEKESKIIGFKFDEAFKSIISASFSMESDTGEFCENQLKIDFLNDKKFDSGNNKLSNSSCSYLKNYGCFKTSEELLEGILKNLPYCQKIKLSESPGFEVGAWVKKSSSENETLKMSIYDIEGNFIQSCVLPEASSGGDEISCNITYFTESEYHYICLSSEQGNGGYYTRGYPDINGCSFNKFPSSSQEENYAYQIFAKGKKFDAFGEELVIIPQDTIEDYLKERYLGLDCSERCIVPIELFSQTSQSINLKNVSIKYNIGGGLTKEVNTLYELNEIPANVNANFQKIYLDNGGFKVQSEYGDANFDLTLNGEEILSEKISIEDIVLIRGLTPTKTVSAYPTTFRVIENSDRNISKYEWDFGDSGIATTKVKEKEHIYNSTGKYSLKITATDSEGFSFSKEFNISVGSPENITKELLDEKLAYLENLNSQIKNFDGFSGESLKSVLEINLINEKLKEIQINYERASSVESYNEVLTELLKIDVPKSVRIRKSAKGVSFYPEMSVLNLDVLKSVGGGNYEEDKKESYKDAIINWHQKNIESKLNFEEFSAEYENYEEPILRVFELKLNEKESLSESPYLIIKKMENLRFKENYLEEEMSDYFDIVLEHSEQTITFSTTENVDFIDLPLFISPRIDKLELIEYQFADEGEFKWLLFILILFFIILAGIIVYVVMQEWYKRKYENYLFKNRNQLYNLFVYIQNSKKKGITDKEIASRLKKARWNSEQVDYVMKKYVGRRTGMFELPVERILNKFRKKKVDRNIGKKV